MQASFRAVVHEGRIEPLEPVQLPEGTRVVVFCSETEDQGFWMRASAPALEAIWANADDDVYAQLLKE